MPRSERVDLSSDISLLLAQLKRLVASRLGRRLQLHELVLVDVDLAQVIIDIDSAVSLYADEETKETWKALKQRIVRKASLYGIKQLSETSQLFIAGADSREEQEGEG